MGGAANAGRYACDDLGTVKMRLTIALVVRLRNELLLSKCQSLTAVLGSAR